jgi:taurine dioxygenase
MDLEAQVVPLGRFGAEVRKIDLGGPDSDTRATWMCALLARYQVLLFRAQTITPQDQLRFTRFFGLSEPGLDRRPAEHKVPGHGDILHLSNAPESVTGDYGFGWHSDGLAYARVPHGVTVLQCKACPPGRGATLFADQYAAFDRLGEALQQKIAGLYWLLPPIPFSEVPAGRYLAQPIVREHPVTGRRFIFCSPAARQICGWSRSDSADLLRSLRVHQTHTECLYRHDWMPGDVLVWENRTLLHTRADKVDCVVQGLRLMYRTATRGDFEAVACEAELGVDSAPA